MEYRIEYKHDAEEYLPGNVGIIKIFEHQKKYEQKYHIGKIIGSKNKVKVPVGKCAAYDDCDNRFNLVGRQGPHKNIDKKNSEQADSERNNPE
jgi:hypothetical protein